MKYDVTSNAMMTQYFCQPAYTDFTRDSEPRDMLNQRI